MPRVSSMAESFRPNLSFDQPFARTGAPTFILANQFDEPSTYIAQWSLGFQRELTRNMTAEATYFGSACVWRLRRSERSRTWCFKSEIQFGLKLVF